MITFGVCQWSLDVAGVPAVQRASELGFETMQIGVRSLEAFQEMRDPTIWETYLEAAAAHGVEIVGMSLGIFNQIALHDPEQEALVWEIMSTIIDAAAAMKLQLVYCPSYGSGLISSDEQMARACAMFRRACEYIGERPLLLASENSLSAAGHRELVERVNHPNMRVLIDAYNPVAYGYKAADLIHELRDMMCNQFHAKDGLKNQSGSTTVGEGDGDFAATAQALRDIGFDGYVICENRYDVDTEARTAADLAALKRLFA